MNINSKVGSAFATGALLAFGIVYFAVWSPVEVAEPKPVISRKAPVPAPHASAPIAAAAPVTVTVREKPSPMPPPVRHEKLVAVAKPVPAPKLVAVAKDDPPPPAEPRQPPPPAPEIVEVTPPPAPAPPAPAVPPVPVQNVSLPAPNAEARVPHTVTLSEGTLLPARIGETLSSARNQPGDTFLATLTAPLVIDGFIIAERGARLEGRVVEAGASHLGISVVRLATADGQNIRIRTQPFVKDAASSTATDAAKIGGGAAIGAIIGAIAGGGKGAAIGAGAGGAVGAGDVLLTHGQAAEIKVETRVSFRVQQSVSITERLD